MYEIFTTGLSTNLPIFSKYFFHYEHDAERPTPS